MPVPSHMVLLAGLPVTVTDEFTVKVAAVDVAAGVQVPVTTQRNWLPFWLSSVLAIV